MKAIPSIVLAEKKQNVARLFLEVGAMKINTETPFTLASGKKSPLYFDHRLLMSLPEIRNALADVWVHEIQSIFEFQNVSLANVVIAGTVSAGVAPAMLLAQKLNVQFAYVRTEPKGHGLGKQWEGAPLRQGQTVLLLDDMITTGKSVAGAAQGVQKVCAQSQSTFLGVTCITRHPFAATKDFVSSLSSGKLFHACFESPQLIEIAEKLGFCSQTDAQMCYSWLEAL
jgi:orotate phosphoribosyltransferase